MNTEDIFKYLFTHVFLDGISIEISLLITISHFYKYTQNETKILNDFISRMKDVSNEFME